MRDDISPIVGAFSRRPISVEPHLHWLRAPPTINVPLSASERQSGWVLGDAAPELRSSSETRYQFPHDLCCSLYGGVMAAAVGSSLAIKLSPKEAFLNSTATRGGETRLAFFTEGGLAR